MGALSAWEFDHGSACGLDLTGREEFFSEQPSIGWDDQGVGFEGPAECSEEIELRDLEEVPFAARLVATGSHDAIDVG